MQIWQRFESLGLILKILKDSNNPELKSVVFDSWFDMQLVQSNFPSNETREICFEPVYCGVTLTLTMVNKTSTHMKKACSLMNNYEALKHCSLLQSSATPQPVTATQCILLPHRNLKISRFSFTIKMIEANIILCNVHIL